MTAAAALAGAALALTLPVVRGFWPATIYHELRSGIQLTERPEHVEKLDLIPLGDTWPSLVSIHELWQTRVPDRDDLFALNRRNDQATGNESFIYWYLNARAAAWPVAFDPGLADRDDLQREVVDRLCAGSPPLVQHVVAYPLHNASRDSHGSRDLDQFTAINYRFEAGDDLFRILLPARDRCRRPETVGGSSVTALRDELLRIDDVTAAAALSTLLLERAESRGLEPEPDDVAVAILGGYWVTDESLPGGKVGRSLRSLRDFVPDRTALTLAALSESPPLVRLATLSAFVALRDPADPANTQVLSELIEFALQHPEWPLAQRNLFALQPPSLETYKALRARGANSVDLERWALGAATQALDRAAGELAARRAFALLWRRPLDRARLLEDLSSLYRAVGDVACARSALAAVDRLPGFAADVSPDAACPLRFTEANLRRG